MIQVGLSLNGKLANINFAEFCIYLIFSFTYLFNYLFTLQIIVFAVLIVQLFYFTFKLSIVFWSEQPKFGVIYYCLYYFTVLSLKISNKVTKKSGSIMNFCITKKNFVFNTCSVQQCLLGISVLNKSKSIFYKSLTNIMLIQNTLIRTQPFWYSSRFETQAAFLF